MKNEVLSEKLKTAISILEKKQTIEFKELKAECGLLLNGFKPLHMIEKLSKSFISEPDVKNSLLKILLNIGAVYVLQKFIPKKTNSFFGKITQLASNLFNHKITHYESN